MLSPNEKHLCDPVLGCALILGAFVCSKAVCLFSGQRSLDRVTSVALKILQKFFSEFYY